MKVLYVIAGIVLVLYVIYQILFPTYTHHYRQTIEVEVDGKIRSASSVIEVRVLDQRTSPIGAEHVVDFYGEAAFLDLGKGRHVIAIIGYGPTGRETPDTPGMIARDVFNLLGGNKQIESYIAMSKMSASSKIELVGQQIPTMVTFSDLTNPATAQVVPIHEFSRVFGSNVRFHAAWIEITNDSITHGIAAKMPLLIQLKAEQSKFRVIRPTDGFLPSLGYFSIER